MAEAPDGPAAGAARVAAFRGAVSCMSAPGAVLGLTLRGFTAERPGEPLTLAFAGAAPGDLPQRLEDALIERSGAGQFRIVTAAHTWTVRAAGVHLHRDVGAAFYGAVPPRPAPRLRRAFLHAVLWLAASRPGRVLLRALRP
jgi:hypothetical protein